MLTNPFTPAATVNASASTSSASVALSPVPLNGVQQCRIFNACTVTAFVRFSAGSTTASLTTDMPIATLTSQIFTVPAGATHMCCILPSSSGTVYATMGAGI